MFLTKCAGCHAVRGTPADGALAPDLTHLMGRKTIGAGVLNNAPEDLRRWVAHTQIVKPGSEMPTVSLESRELEEVTSYLSTLQ